MKIILVNCLLRFGCSLGIEGELSFQNKNSSPVNIVGVSRVKYLPFFVLRLSLVNHLSRVLSVVKLLLIAG